jgi:hypothetical protein
MKNKLVRKTVSCYVSIDTNIDTNVDIDVIDFMESLSDGQMDYIRSEYFNLPKEEEMTHQEIEWRSVLDKIYNNRFSLTQDEEMLIRNISNRF